MKTTAVCFAALLAGSGVVYAQTSPSSPANQNSPGMMDPSSGNGSSGSGTGPNTTGSTPAPSATGTHDVKPGANSFTEAQARERIERAGFSNVGQLMKSPDGVWRGKAMKNGSSVQVSVDYMGNVASM